jgi:hypothetical protein
MLSKEHASAMPRFVIQQHAVTADQIHWDLMLEFSGQLATWQVPVQPAQWGAAVILCPKIFPHRMHYLTYEGPLSDNRGIVTIVARGIYEVLQQEEKCWRVLLRGDTIAGVLELRCVEGDNWQLQFLNRSV